MREHVKVHKAFGGMLHRIVDVDCQALGKVDHSGNTTRLGLQERGAMVIGIIAARRPQGHAS